jgi:enoyl-CoA hydratase/carnithine racemase
MTAELKSSRHNATLILTMLNPGPHNALDCDMAAAAIETLSKAERAPDIHNVVITGTEREFCSGVSAGKDLHTQIDALENLQNLIETLRSFPKPVIAAVEGRAIDAGFSLALACDLIVAGQSASFGVSSAQTGTWAIGGASWFLPKVLPTQWLTEMFLDAKPVSAVRLHTSGLVNKLAPDGMALEQALNWSEQLSATTLAAFEQLKILFGNASAGTTLNQHFSLEKHALLTKRNGNA